MSETGKAQHTRQAPGARFAPGFWDAVECEIEALDADDFALFLAADELALEPRADFVEALGATLAAAGRARFSN